EAAATLVHDESARHLAAVLADPEGLGVLERAHLVQAYAQLVGIVAKARPQALRQALEDPHPAVRLAATAALVRVGAAPQADLDAAADAALASPDRDARRIAREELRAELRRSTIGDAAFAAQLGQL